MIINSILGGKQEEEKTVSTPDFSAGNIEVNPTAGKTMSKVTLTKDTTNHVPENIKKDVSLYGITGTMEAGGGTTGFEVRYIDYDGTIIDTQYIQSGEDSTPPANPDRTAEGLTFQEWNNPSTNITRDRDIGATYRPTDYKTHVFISLCTNVGLTFQLCITKSDTSTLTIDWGDSSTEDITTSGTITPSHTYSTYGDYEVKVHISSGAGTYTLGSGTNGASFAGYNTANYRAMVKKIFVGNALWNGYCFGNNPNLTSIVLPNLLLENKVAGAFFYQSIGVLCVIVPKSISILNYRFFSGCKGIETISVPNTITDIKSGVFRDCSSMIRLYLPDSITSWGTYGEAPEFFNGCYSIEELIIPGLVAYTRYMFNVCYSLKNVTFLYSGDEYIYFESYCFYRCYSLVEVIGTKIATKSAGDYTSIFYECYSLSHFENDVSTGTFGSNCFRTCYKMREFDLRDYVSTIEAAAFYGSSGILKYIIRKTGTVVTLADTNAFYNINPACKIYVPDALVDSYKVATNWSTYANYIYPLSELE